VARLNPCLGQEDGTSRDVSKLTVLGLAPRTRLPEGIASTYAWFIENQVAIEQVAIEDEPPLSEAAFALGEQQSICR
jgi:hypothetical protein